jgi:serine protease Do
LQTLVELIGRSAAQYPSDQFQKDFPMRNSQSLRVYRNATITLVAGMVAGGAVWLGRSPIGDALALSSAKPMSTATSPATAGLSSTATSRSQPDFATIVDQYGAAVVNISVSGTTKTAFAQIDPNDPFYEFFRRFGGVPQHGSVPTRATGSGFIVSADGVVLTNAHVVADADEVTVKLTDKREFKAKVIGVDKPTDVAVLKISTQGLPAVHIGNPQQTRVGEWVLAIGSPFGFENSATSGIVSAKSRSLPDEGYVPFLQTDVAINPGNSGGPLFNLNGEVIGINSQIYSRSGGYQGLSFAIPIDVAIKVEQQLLAHGKVSRGRLGVVIQNVDQALADSFGMAKPEGALVSSVEEGSPGAMAGLKTGDVILAFNNTAIGTSSDLPPLVADMAPGSKANLQVWRDGHSKTLGVTVGESSVASAAGSAGPNADKGRLGLAVRPLTAEEKAESHLLGGLMVEGVSGVAARAGIQPGDVVLAVNGQGISSVEQLRALAAKAGKRLALLVQREDGKLFVPLNLG